MFVTHTFTFACDICLIQESFSCQKLGEDKPCEFYKPPGWHYVDGYIYCNKHKIKIEDIKD